MLPEPKKAAAIILGGKSPEVEKEDPEMDQSEGLKVCAEELLSAIESKDSAGVISALKAFFEQVDLD